MDQTPEVGADSSPLCWMWKSAPNQSSRLAFSSHSKMVLERNLQSYREELFLLLKGSQLYRDRATSVLVGFMLCGFFPLFRR